MDQGGQGREDRTGVKSDLRALPLDAQLERLLTGWRTLHPAAVMHYQPDTVPAPCVALDPRFAPALLNVLNNAAEASPTPIDLQATWHGGQLELTLVNQGAALPAVPLGSAWPPLGQSSQKGGLGLGMALTHAVVWESVISRGHGSRARPFACSTPWTRRSIRQKPRSTMFPTPLCQSNQTICRRRARTESPSFERPS